MIDKSILNQVVPANSATKIKLRKSISATSGVVFVVAKLSSVVAKISSVVAKFSSVVAKMSYVLAKISSVLAIFSSVLVENYVYCNSHRYF